MPGHLADQLVFLHGSCIWKFWSSQEYRSQPDVCWVLDKRSPSHVWAQHCCTAVPQVRRLPAALCVLSTRPPSVRHTHNTLTAFQKPGDYQGGIMSHTWASLYPKSPREKHDNPQHGSSSICRKAWPSLLNGPSACPCIRNSSGVQAVLQQAACDASFQPS